MFFSSVFSIYLFFVLSYLISEAYWRSEWGYSGFFFTKFSSSRAGVGILFNNNFQFNVLRSFIDPEGRFIIVDIETKGEVLTLLNIYAANQDDPSFYKIIGENVFSFKCDFIVFGGDFNLVCDVHKDKKGGVPVTHWKSRVELECLKKKFELTDIWRVLNPHAMRFTWRRKKNRNSMPFGSFSS